MAIQIVERLAIRPIDRSARNRRQLAPPRLQAVLAIQIQKKIRTTKD